MECLTLETYFIFNGLHQPKGKYNHAQFALTSIFTFVVFIIKHYDSSLGSSHTHVTFMKVFVSFRCFAFTFVFYLL